MVLLIIRHKGEKINRIMVLTEGREQERDTYRILVGNLNEKTTWKT